MGRQWVGVGAAMGGGGGGNGWGWGPKVSDRDPMTYIT